MKNKKRNTVIWILTWAVLFLVVAYSPIGRPDLYVGTAYYISSPGVNLRGGIANAPKGTAYATSDEGESELTDYAPTTSENVDYNGNVAEYSPQNTNGGGENYSKTTGANQTSTQYGGIIGSGRSLGANAQGTATQSNDVSSLSSDLTLTSSAGVDRQAAPPNKPNGGRDPGGKNPKNPIPVGDGTCFLLIMIGAYAFWRKR